MIGKTAFGAFHAIVHGRVQGVGFRYNTRSEALRRGLTGWVRNLRNGTVEVTAEGEKKKLALFAKWLEQGPPGARVTSLDFKSVEYTGSFQTFSIKI